MKRLLIFASITAALAFTAIAETNQVKRVFRVSSPGYAGSVGVQTSQGVYIVTNRTDGHAITNALRISNTNLQAASVQKAISNAIPRAVYLPRPHPNQ